MFFGVIILIHETLRKWKDLATIKEVAKLAEVSIGTVSNVLNGKTKNTTLIDRVENAIKELSYRPDANARSLKNTKSAVVGIILPNMENPAYPSLLHSIEETLKIKGYSVLVKFSQNNRLLEKKCIEQCLEHCVDGILIYSNSNCVSFEKLPLEKVPVILIGTHNTTGFAGDSIHIDYSNALEKALRHFRDSGVGAPGLIVESDLFADACRICKKYYQNKGDVILVDSSKERGFKAAYELLYANPGIKGILAGNKLIAQGIEKALHVLNLENILLTVVKECNWIEDDETNHAQISVSYKKVAQSAVERLLDAMENPNTHEVILKTIQAVYTDTRPSIHIARHSDPIRLAMFDCPAAQSLKMLSGIYARESGMSVSFEMMAYDELEKTIADANRRQSSNFDGYMVDITWLDSLAENGALFPLEHLKKGNSGYFRGFIREMLSEYGEHDGRLFAIPFMSGTQLMFYQKDLFEDRMLSNRFSHMFGGQLAPPVNWAQYNLVSEFFTRSLNPRSPVKYGTSNVRGENVYTTISFLNRLWSYGSDVFDEKGRIVINNGNSLTALKNFTKSYQYCSGRAITSWDEMTAEFMSGDAAMVVLYDSHAVWINDYTKSKVAGNIGFSLIPGGAPVLGGWSLAANTYGKHRDAANDFFMWACSERNEIPISLLGGSTLRSDYYTRADLENIYPWKSLLAKSYAQSRKRVLPKPFSDCSMKDEIYPHLLSREINRAIEGDITEKEALLRIEQELRRLLPSDSLI